MRMLIECQQPSRQFVTTLSACLSINARKNLLRMNGELKFYFALTTTFHLDEMRKLNKSDGSKC